MTRLLLPVLIAVTLVASVVLSVHRARHVPAPADLDAAAAAVRAAFAPGDLIMVEPRHMVGPRQRLGDLPLWEPRAIAAEELLAFRRVHLLSVDAVRGSGGLRPQLEAISRAEQRQRFGLVTLTTFRLPPPERVLFDLSERVAELSVSARYRDGVEAACDRFDRDRWLCPRDPGWSYVGRELLEIGGELRECVWMHPVKDGGVLRVELPELAVAGRIRGGFGFSDESGPRAAAPVRLRLHAGEMRLLQAVRPVEPGWQRFAAELPAGAGPLAVEVDTPDNGASHLCVALRIFEATP